MPTLADAPRPLELLAPARDTAIAREAIIHGADAVYIGASGFGARASACNDVAEIASLCSFAHSFRARVYVTVNTIVYPSELPKVQALIEQLYNVGVDAVIVQDMGLLRLSLPPIELHASTQCDTRTPAKARFLQEVGFSQIVLARELTLREIREVCREVSVPIEVFVHGALCVSYSGRCHASQALCSRSANRGECAQICRLPFTLTDNSGHVLARNRHLLSLHDFNASPHLRDLVEAGASSFKIEGRLKDATYVKNVTAYYRRALDEIIAAEPGRYCRASCGTTDFSFTPALEKSFNRGFSTYFLTQRRPRNLASTLTPKSLGEPLTSLSDVHNGDGLSFFTPKGEYTGFLVNGVEGSRVIPNKRIAIPRGVQFFRTTDVAWQRLMARGDTATRRIAIDITLHPGRIEACDERGCRVVLSHELPLELASRPMDFSRYFAKLGDTIYTLRSFESHIPATQFAPASALTQLRRRLVKALDSNARATYRRPLRRPENREVRYPNAILSFADNVANPAAEQFYREHGVTDIEPAMEVGASAPKPGTRVMTTRHCVLRELGLCLRQADSQQDRRAINMPLTLSGAGRPLTIECDCKACEMQISLGK